MSHCPYCNTVITPGSVHCDHCGATSDVRTTPPVISPQLDAELRMILSEGQKIQAIKHLRESTGAGLKEAKDAVERLEQGLPPAAPDAAAQDRPLQDELAALLRAGRKIEAIKLYRARTGAGLKEAKDAVERMGIAPDPGASRPGSGCLGVLLLLVIGGAAIVAAL
ncbi:MAG: ribosomal protein L7/L12 [Isosphaeraceae bacterium]